jgi:hypothetical protein
MVTIFNGSNGPKAVYLAFGLFFSLFSHAQQGAQVNGNFSMDAQYYREDSIIGAEVPAERAGINAWGNIIYRNGDFSAGVRFESYEPPLLGYPAGQTYQGSGIGYRYVTYTKNDLEVTMGNFYEQFGTGLVFRSYEERYLGVDNAMDGARLKYSPMRGVYLKGVVGRQRFSFEGATINGDGIVRGFDAEVSLNELLDSSRTDAKFNWILGGSFVSRFQADRDPVFNLPENVGLYGARINATSLKWNLYAEYAHKINDPNASNGGIYKDGEALMLNATYSVKGLGVSAGIHTYDNMFFQSDRGAPSPFDVNINFLSPLAKQHTYNLAATLYPYATQPNGEFSYQGEVFYKIKKGSKLGGKYGTKLTLNYSAAYSLDTTQIAADTLQRVGYETNALFSPGDRQYFGDFNIELRKKFSKKTEVAVTYFNLIYDIEQIQGKAGKPVIMANLFVVDALYKFNSKNSLRTEVQYLQTEQDLGNWATVLAELTFSPHWFVAALDQYNFGKDGSGELHYPYGSVGYVRGGNRFAVSYGRQRAGIFCVGGVCRNVPASNGFSLSVTSTF